MKSDEAPIDLQSQHGRRRLSLLPDVRMRCEPPPGLSEAERAIWEDIVSAVQPGWLYGSEALLRAYVSAVAQLETLARARPRRRGAVFAALVQTDAVAGLGHQDGRQPGHQTRVNAEKRCRPL